MRTESTRVAAFVTTGVTHSFTNFCLSPVKMNFYLQMVTNFEISEVENQDSETLGFRVRVRFGVQLERSWDLQDLFDSIGQ